jgi:hypothetical protein
MACAPADIVRYDLDAALADWRWPQEIDGQPSKMGQAVARGDALDGPADERRGRTGVLMGGIPGAASKPASAKGARAKIDVSRVQDRGSFNSSAGNWRRGAARCAPQAPVAQEKRFAVIAS